MKNPTKILVAFTLAVFANIILVGCNSGGDDGPMLSDDEKIKKASQGRDAQMGQQQGGAPPASAPTAGK